MKCLLKSSYLRQSRNDLNACAIALTFIACASSSGDALDDVLAFIPKDAASLIVIPSLAKISGDIDACVAGMDRKETVIAGRPVDQLRGMLGIRESFDERGSMAAWTTSLPSGDAKPGEVRARPFVLLIPSEDPDAFVKANLAPGDDGVGTFRNEKVYSRTLAKHVIVSTSKTAVDGYDAAGGIGSVLAKKIGERGMALAHGGDLVAWASAIALAESQAAATEQAQQSGQMPEGIAAGFAGRTEKFRELFAGVSDGLLVLDADALGLSVRAYSVYLPESELTKIASDAKPVTGNAAATLSGLPKSSFYLAAAIDAQALGGANKIDALTAALGVSEFVPAWLSQAKEGVRSIRFAAYPSKLGILAGGALNDCAFLIETEQPQVIRDLFKSSLMAQAGKSDGVRKEPSWEDGRTLKNGTVADAFELKETPLGPSEAEGADLSGVAMRQITRQAIFGSRGMHGFVKVMPKSVLITFSQRPDVLDRAISAANGGDSLKDESVLVAMRPWLVPGAQVEAFISVGQILKVVKQIADSFGGGGMALPSIPSRSPPIAIALRSDPQSFEAAVMIPTAVLAAGYDQILSGAFGGGRTKQTDANKAEKDGGNVKIAP